MAGARVEDEWWQNSKTSATRGTWRQKKARSATCHLAKCCHQRLREGRTVLGRNNVFNSRQKTVEKLDCSSRGGLRSKVRSIRPVGMILYALETLSWHVTSHAAAAAAAAYLQALRRFHTDSTRHQSNRGVAASSDLYSDHAIIYRHFTTHV